MQNVALSKKIELKLMWLLLQGQWGKITRKKYRRVLLQTNLNKCSKATEQKFLEEYSEASSVCT